MNVDRIADTEQLDDLLSEPTAAAVDALARLPGDLVILGVAGKMGPTLARMARRTSDRAGVQRRVIGVARFTDAALEMRLQRRASRRSAATCSIRPSSRACRRCRTSSS